MKKIRFFIIFLLFSGLILGCMSLPSPEESDCILIIPVEYKNNSDHHIEKDYFLHFSNNNYESKIQIMPPFNKFKIIKDLSPGEYKFYKLETINENGQRWNSVDFESMIILEKGSISIFPRKLLIRIEKELVSSNYYRYAYSNFFGVLPEKEIDQIGEDIKSLKNFDQWKLKM